MLESISIKNIALIDEATIDFGRGLNVLTGETGAGKSMIIDSLNFTLGEKTSRDIIRAGEKTGRVEAVFRVAENFDFGFEDGIEPDDEGLLIIARTINESGKTSARINGQAVTAQMLKKITAELIDIHGQHEHQSLLNPQKQLDFIDGFCGAELAAKKSAFESEFKEFGEIKRKIEKIEKMALDKETRLEYLEYRIAELEEARLKEGEEEALMDEKKAAAAAEKLQTCVETALDVLYDRMEYPAADSINNALRATETAAGYDKRLVRLVDRLSDAAFEINDIASDLRRYRDNIGTDPSIIDEIEDRLNQIYIIKRKYGGSVSNAINCLKKMREERDTLSGSTFELGLLRKQFEEKKAVVSSLCQEITALRKKNSEKMEKLITVSLKDLNMENAVFQINLSEAELSKNGADKAEILFSANKGEDVKPLAKIASGGETSRVMLAVKSVAASGGVIDTFIFDEIDTGVSGRAAQKVAEKMAVLAAKKQLICITHLPQIAAMADKHILIEKETKNGKTLTKTAELEGRAITNELGRLLGGAKITEQTLKAAAEMKELAIQIKNNNSGVDS